MTERPRARQSQLVTTYGIGALLPVGDRSYMIAGLDDWPEAFCPPVDEPRLARSLSVGTFRAPSYERQSGDVPAVRFPQFHYCPGCRRLDRFWKFDRDGIRCLDCLRDLTPSRFVACCEHGHIEDFPYYQWVHRGQGAEAAGDHRMRLTTRGASSSLADIVVSCSCGVRPLDLDGIFESGALRQVKQCGGRRPWLTHAEDEACSSQLRVLQRGSSNVWFPEVRSSISIPPWSSPNSRLVSQYWSVLASVPEHALSETITNLVAGSPAPGVSARGVLNLVLQRRGIHNDHSPTEDELRAEEYLALVDGNDGGSHDAFQCIQEDVDPLIEDLVTQVSRVSRLREVRALAGFTRVTPKVPGESGVALSPLSTGVRAWLPAVEIFGEGVFVRFDEGSLERWETSKLARERASLLETALDRRAAEYGTRSSSPSARYLALHSLAHALVKELSLDAGYPVGSLRERVFAGEDQAGILIYTASSDAAGSLGGLASLAAPDRLGPVIQSAAGRMMWCSNDPVCAESGPSGPDGLNLAACHACLLLPETSCEARNLFLDRTTLTGATDGLDGLLGALIRSRVPPHLATN